MLLVVLIAFSKAEGDFQTLVLCFLILIYIKLVDTGIGILTLIGNLALAFGGDVRKIAALVGEHLSSEDVESWRQTEDDLEIAKRQGAINGGIWSFFSLLMGAVVIWQLGLVVLN